METAHARTTTLYARASLFLAEGHCFWIALSSKHLELLVEDNTKMNILVDTKELEAVIDGAIASVKIIKVPNNRLTSRELERQVVIEHCDDTYSINMGHTRQTTYKLGEEIVYVRVVRSDPNHNSIKTTDVAPTKKSKNQRNKKGPNKDVDQHHENENGTDDVQDSNE